MSTDRAEQYGATDAAILAGYRKRIAELEAALKYVRSLAHMEQSNPTEMHMTCLSIIEKTADEALGN